MEMTPEQIAEELAIAKGRAIEFWKANRVIVSKKLGQIRINEFGFNHIEMKDPKHRRENSKEILYRYRCFLYVKRILESLGEYQEFCEGTVHVPVKRHGKIVYENRPTKFYGFIAIINDKIRVKIVVRKVDGFNHYEFVSVCPVWKTTFYTDFKMVEMFEDLPE